MINSDDGKSVAVSQYLPMTVGFRNDTVVNSAFGNAQNLYYLTDNFFPIQGARWCQLLTDGAYCMPGASLYAHGTARFMVTSSAVGLSSGYLDVFDGGGQLIWSAASAGSMPRVQGFFYVPPGYNLTGNVLTVNTPIPNPWFCVSQCPGNVSDDGFVVGYSGIQIRRNSATNFSLTYPSNHQYNFLESMGGNGLNITLASFTGY